MSGIIDPNTSPIQPIPPVQGPTGMPTTPDEAKEFLLPGTSPSPTEGPKPNPMEVAADQGRGQQPVTPESLEEQMDHLKEIFNNAQNKLQDPRVARGLRSDQQEALGKLVDKLNPDMSRIAKHSEVEYTPKTKGKDESLLGYVSDWIDGSQTTISNAIASVGNMKNPNPAQMLRLQYDIQRASQRGELFSSIIGGSVSGIKTIMSTQLG